MHGITTESSKEVHNGSDSQACNESLEEEIIIITNKIIIIYSSLLSTKKMIGQRDGIATESLEAVHKGL